MANPNISALTSVTGFTIFDTMPSSLTSVLSNASGSNTIIKINTIIVSNIHNSNNVDISFALNSAASGGGSNYYISKNITVPINSSLVIVGKDAPIYLTENRSVVCIASASSNADYTISYETIS